MSVEGSGFRAGVSALSVVQEYAAPPRCLRFLVNQKKSDRPDSVCEKNRDHHLLTPSRMETAHSQAKKLQITDAEDRLPSGATSKFTPETHPTDPVDQNLKLGTAIDVSLNGKWVSYALRSPLPSTCFDCPSGPWFATLAWVETRPSTELPAALNPMHPKALCTWLPRP